MMVMGILRKVDELGRIVLPIEIRRALNIEEKDSLSIEINDGAIILKKCQPTCVFCRAMANVITYKEKQVCRKCAGKIAGLSVNEDEVC